MNNADLLRRYQKMEIETSSPEKLVLFLYNKAIKCLNEANMRMKEKDMEASNSLLLRTQRIIRELMCSLNPGTKEISTPWYSLYQYMYERLIQANIQKNPDIVEEVISLLEPLREAWVKAMEIVDEDHN